MSHLPRPVMRPPREYEQCASGLEMYYFDNLSPLIKQVWTSYPIQMSLVELINGPHYLQVSTWDENEFARRIIQVYTENTIDSALIKPEAVRVLKEINRAQPI